ncbi:hypothetical protein DFH29DRAFT_448225 [Suillus ampliporus]|nr:hypothetical protein DFH29DRAFT_448225 [Suillus ampliporus]
MAAYNIPSNVPNDSDALLTPFWQLRPAGVTFGRIVKMVHEGAIVFLYGGKIRFIRPDLDNSESNAYVIEEYTVSSVVQLWLLGVTHLLFQVKPPHPHSSQWPCLFAAQRIFWLSCMPSQKEPAGPWKMAIETTAVSENDHCEGRALMDFQETQTSDPHPTARSRIVQDWDELSGRLCIRSAQNCSSQDPMRRSLRTAWRVTLVDFV